MLLPLVLSQILVLLDSFSFFFFFFFHLFPLWMIYIDCPHNAFVLYTQVISELRASLDFTSTSLQPAACSTPAEQRLSSSGGWVQFVFCQ